MGLRINLVTIHPLHPYVHPYIHIQFGINVWIFFKMIIRIFSRIIIVTYSFPEEKIGCLESFYPPLCRHLPAQEAGLPLPTRLGCNQLPSGPVLFYHPQCKYNRIITYNCTIHCESQRSKGTAVSAALPDPRGALHGGRQVGAARPGARLFLFSSFSFILVLFVQSTFGGGFFSQI